MDFAAQHKLYVIEDCAQAHGARINGQPVGSFGDMAAFSFCQDKIISTMGEGGLVATKQKHLWEKAWAYKDHGKGYGTVFNKQHPQGFRWLHDSFGSNYRMTEAQAAIGRIQLSKLEAWVKVRQQFAAIFNETLQDLPSIRLTIPPEDICHAYYRYYCFVEPSMLKEGWSRDKIMAEINQCGIVCTVGSCSEIYLEQAFQNYMSNDFQRLPLAKSLGELSLAFLVDPIYTCDQMQQDAQRIYNILKQACH
jgi:hypothetical protein